MNILIFDTETTGIPDYNAGIDDACQPYLVQLAAILCGERNNTIAKLSLIVNNDGIEIPEGAAKVHGITTDMAATLGTPVSVALSPFIHLWRISDLVVAHNYKFDDFILRTAIARRWGAIGKLPERQSFCTMEALAPIINLPPSPRMRAAGIDKPKPPRLEEAFEHFFGAKFFGAHDALTDAEACRKIYFHLQQIDARRAA